MNKSVRLTNGKRDSIIEQEVDKKFFDKENSLKDDLMASINKALVKTVPKWITPEIEGSGYIKKKLLLISALRLQIGKTQHHVF